MLSFAGMGADEKHGEDMHRTERFEEQWTGMTGSDGHRDGALGERIRADIEDLAARIGRSVTLMEICGAHTCAIGRCGIRNVLPERVRIVSGPGCPVCVTSGRDVDTALFLAGRKNVIFTACPDMLRVPGSGGGSLQGLCAAGADVRAVESVAQAMDIAGANPGREVISMGTGFEASAHEAAWVLEKCRRQKIRNLSVFSVYKVMQPAITALLDDPELAVDGFLCPGHAETGAGYAEIPARGRAAVVTGFEALDILEGIRMALSQIARRSFAVERQGTGSTGPDTGTPGDGLTDEVFMRVPAEWRGLGVIPDSALVLRNRHAVFNALARFDVPILDSSDIMGCMCGSILRGVASPPECPLFGHACNPENPIGPCMVSREGACFMEYAVR